MELSFLQGRSYLCYQTLSIMQSRIDPYSWKCTSFSIMFQQHISMEYCSSPAIHSHIYIYIYTPSGKSRKNLQYPNHIECLELVPFGTSDALSCIVTFCRPTNTRSAGLLPDGVRQPSPPEVALQISLAVEIHFAYLRSAFFSATSIAFLQSLHRVPFVPFQGHTIPFVSLFGVPSPFCVSSLSFVSQNPP